MTRPTGNPAIDDPWLQDFDNTATAADEIAISPSFGKLTINPHRYFEYVETSPGTGVWTAEDRTAEQYRQLSRNKGFEVMFAINIQEFAPHLAWQYERRVTIKSQRNSEWQRIVKPSMEKVLGMKFKKGDFAKAVGKLNGQYVEVHPELVDPDAAFPTIKFVRIFNNRDECFKAWSERYGGGSVQQPTPAPASSGTAAPQPVTSTADPEFPEGIYGDYAAWKSMVPSIKDALAKGAKLPQVAIDFGGVDIKYIINAKNGLYD